MQEEEALISVFDEKGNIIAEKFRKDVDKSKDILKTSNVLVFDDSSKLLLIKEKNPEIWNNKWGGSCATLVRKGEVPYEAAKRVLKRELGLEIEPKFVGSKFLDMNGIKRFWSLFVVRGVDYVKPNASDFTETSWFKIEDVEKMIKEGKCMPSLEEALRIYSDIKG